MFYWNYQLAYILCRAFRFRLPWFIHVVSLSYKLGVKTHFSFTVQLTQPAANPYKADLTGKSLELLHLVPPHLFYLVDECWPPLYACFNFRMIHVALVFSLAFSVSYSSVAVISIYPVLIYASNILTSVSRWISLIVVMAGWLYSQKCHRSHHISVSSSARQPQL